ncbi:MAG: TIGR02996 domain-containing protein [Gemmataceae bacterium]|nr:TIGR02996 domain-containing protein [Gemmataceae bacterium]
MTTEDALLAAVDAAPGDPTPRLVYADWLDDRGDPRAELVRVEEEMALLPVFGDRFWELKPRRNELRAAAPAGWLARMGYGTVCRPVFRHGWPDGWRERWRLIREFTERWHGLPMPDVGGRQVEVAEVEQRLGRTLPPSTREFVAFAHDARRNDNYFDFFRDSYQMEDVPGHPAVSLVLQGEGDYHWAARHEDLVLADPPVFGYHSDYKNDDYSAFVPDNRNPVTDTLTEYVFEYARGYTHGRGGGFGVTATEPDRLIPRLAAALPCRARFGSHEVFEADDVLVVVGPSFWAEGEARLDVEVCRTIPRDRVPPILWEYCRNGGSFHGMFVPEEARRQAEERESTRPANRDDIPF